MAPLPPCSRKLLDKTVKTFAVFSSWLHLLDGEDNCMLSVPLSTSDLHCSCWQSGENLPGVVHRGFHVVVPRVLIFFEVCSSLFFCVLPTRRLLDVSCLLGLTLRPSAPVFCCHQDSLTPGRLAFAQEAVRVSSFQSPLIGSACDGMWLLIFRQPSRSVSSRVTEI